MTTPVAATVVVRPWISKILFFIAAFFFLLLTFKEAGVITSDSLSWLLGGGLTATALGLFFA